jgi:hypothetical protein
MSYWPSTIQTRPHRPEFGELLVHRKLSSREDFITIIVRVTNRRAGRHPAPQGEIYGLKLKKAVRRGRSNGAAFEVRRTAKKGAYKVGTAP